MVVSVRNITKSYKEQKAVDRVSFEIGKGEVVGFIGPNGAGKTTTMKIITGNLTPDSGEVFINGLAVADHTLETRRITGYLPENNPLYTELYVREYLEHIAGLYGMDRKTATARSREMIDLTGLEREQHKKIGALSKGYRQRVGLAQALIHDPQLLILDEPTSGLDPNQIVGIRNLISGLGKEKTILLSTHIMQEVEAICDKIILIDRGVIKADDKASELIRNRRDELQTYLVELAETPEVEKWLELPFVSKVRKLPGNQYLIEAPAGKDSQAGIFRHAVENKLTILSFSVREKNLETIFRELTEK